MTTTNGFRDHYETLQLGTNADPETIDRVYRILAKRYHPDNQDTGNASRFSEVLEAYRVLSNPEQRAAYDARYEDNRAKVLRIFEEFSGDDSLNLARDRRIFESILSLLYITRRRDPEQGGLGTVQIEKLLGAPAGHLEFHLWYLRRKRWVERLDSGTFAITAEGVDCVIEEQRMIVPGDRLLHEPQPEQAGATPRSASA